MAIVLTKGSRLDLAKSAPGVTQFFVGLSWGENKFDSGAKFDADVSVFGLKNGKLHGEQNFVFYNSEVRTPDRLTTVIETGSYGQKKAKGTPCSPCLGIIHTGDNEDGKAVGIDEALLFDIARINSELDELSMVVTIHEAKERNQNFGQIPDISLVIRENDENGTIIAEFDLADNFSTETCVQVGSLVKKDDSWRFVAVAAGYNRGLEDFITKYTSAD